MSRFRDLAAATGDTIFWHPVETPGDTLRRLADLADELEVRWDSYGARGPVAVLEDRLADLFGRPAAFFPSGVMAQQSALRVWCERDGTRRVAMPDISHLLVHEMDGPRRLHGFEMEHLTSGPEVATAESLGSVVGSWARCWWSCRCATRAVAFRPGRSWWSCRRRPGTGACRCTSTAPGSGSRSPVGTSRSRDRGPDGQHVRVLLQGPARARRERHWWVLRTSWPRRGSGGPGWAALSTGRLPEALAALAGLRDLLPRMAECYAWAQALGDGAPGSRDHPEPDRAARSDVPAARGGCRGRGQRAVARGHGARATAGLRALVGRSRAGSGHHGGGGVDTGSRQRTGAGGHAAGGDSHRLTGDS